MRLQQYTHLNLQPWTHIPFCESVIMEAPTWPGIMWTTKTTKKIQRKSIISPFSLLLYAMLFQRMWLRATMLTNFLLYILLWETKLDLINSLWSQAIIYLCNFLLPSRIGKKQKVMCCRIDRNWLVFVVKQMTW